MDNQKIYFIIAQRTSNGKYINCWINGSEKKEMIKNEAFFEMIVENGLDLILPDIKETVIRTYSLYMIDFSKFTIKLLSAVLAEKEQEVMEVINQTTSIVDKEYNNRQNGINIDQIMNIGSGLNAYDTALGKKNSKNKPQISKQRTQNEVESSFNSGFQNFLKRHIK
jgi:hypothetical protein